MDGGNLLMCTQSDSNPGNARILSGGTASTEVPDFPFLGYQGGSAVTTDNEPLYGGNARSE